MAEHYQHVGCAGADRFRVWMVVAVFYGRLVGSGVAFAGIPARNIERAGETGNASETDQSGLIEVSRTQTRQRVVSHGAQH